MEELGPLLGANHESDRDIVQIASGMESVAAVGTRIPSRGVATDSRSSTTKAAFMNPTLWQPVGTEFRDFYGFPLGPT